MNIQNNRLKINTSNPNKLEEFRKLGIHAEASKIDLSEPDSDPLTIIRYKATQAGENVLVEDTSISIIEDSHSRDLVRIKFELPKLKSLTGEKAIVRVLIGLMKNGEIEVYRGLVPGQIVKPKGQKGFGFDSMFKPQGSEFTLAEYKPNKYNARALAVQNFLDRNPWQKVPPLFKWEGDWQQD